MRKFIFILFFLPATFVGFCQISHDSASIKIEEAKKRVLYNLRNQKIMYSNQTEFDFINYLKPSEKIDFSMKLNYKETQNEKAIRKWNQYKTQQPLCPYYPAFRINSNNYYFTTY